MTEAAAVAAALVAAEAGGEWKRGAEALAEAEEAAGVGAGAAAVA